MMDIKPANENLLVRWVYTKEEWQHFESWHAKYRGIFSYIWHICFNRGKHIPAIEFTQQTLHQGAKTIFFKGPERELRRIDIQDKGNLNIMNITYEVEKNKLQEIKVPIPRGKLREAIAVQEKLMNDVKLV